MSSTYEDMSILISDSIGNISSKTALDLESLILGMKQGGVSDEVIRQTILNDLNIGGRIMGQFKNGVKNTTRSGILGAGNLASRKTYGDAGVKEFRWIAVSGSQACPDCMDRHGETGSMEYFESIGTPRSGFSVCGVNCQCQLEPSNYKGKGLDKPILRGKRPPKKLSMTHPKMAGKHKTVADSLKWMRENISNKVTLGQMGNLAHANRLTATLQSTMSKHNLSKLTSVKHNKGRAWASASYDSLTINKTMLNDDFLDNIFEKQKASYGGNPNVVYRGITYTCQEIIDGDFEDWMKNMAVDKMAKSKASPYSRHNVFIKGKELESIITHEFGHIIHDQYTGMINGSRWWATNDPKLNRLGKMGGDADYWNKRWKKIFRDLKKSGEISKISEYASSDNMELFAESFAMYELGEKANLPVLIREYLDEYLELMKGN